MKWTQEKDKYLRSLIANHGTKWKLIAKEMQKQFNEVFKSEQVRARWRTHLRYEEPDIDPKDKYGQKINKNSDGTIEVDQLIEISKEQLKDDEYILQAHGYDPSKWEITSHQFSMWNHFNKELTEPKTLYASKIKVQPKSNELNWDEIKEDIRDLFKNYKPKIFTPIRYADNGRALEVNISDLHLNKLGYINGEYDHNEAERRFFHVIDDVLSETKEAHFQKIFFIWSHDFFNIDHLTKTTTAGTPQDVSQRFSDMYKQGKRMLIQGIDYLKQIAPVETVQVGANHDRLTSYTLSEVLHAWYKNDDNVTIDTDPLHRKYRRWGKCLIGFSHGDKEKKRLGKIMPVEARKDWGETLFCEIHAAHIHTEKAVVEENGVIVRYLSPLSGTDTWHYESGYVGSQVKAQSFIWDKELGIKNIIQSPIIRR